MNDKVEERVSALALDTDPEAGWVLVEKEDKKTRARQKKAISFFLGGSFSMTEPDAGPPGAFAVAAEDYWRQGLFPLPLGGRNGEEPLIRGFTKMRRPSLAAVRRWSERFPAANVGLVTGAVGNLTVIVIHSADPAILRAIEARCGQTRIVVRTPSGCWHVYYGYNGERCGNFEAEGLPVDIKGQGGYVVAPPSVPW